MVGGVVGAIVIVYFFYQAYGETLLGVTLSQHEFGKFDLFGFYTSWALTHCASFDSILYILLMAATDSLVW